MERPYSGYAELIGYELIEKTRDFARLRLVIGPQHLNRMEVPHGGVLATLLDTATGFAVALADGPDRILRAVTLSMNVQFVGQARAGDTIFAEGQRIGGGRTIAFARGELRDQNGGVIARGDATYRFLDRPAAGSATHDPETRGRN
ncbi:MAG: PaaI family thioesterase [Rhodospirillaceae bacterium]|nr:PaaI family thioesterase [Rhodospirillaceae bacterium]